MATDPTLKAGDLVKWTNSRGVTTLIPYRAWLRKTQTNGERIEPPITEDNLEP